MNQTAFTSITSIIEKYDEMLSFEEYFDTLFHDYPGNTVNRGEMKICCPLHDEDTPSFMWSKAIGHWTCFGACNTGGKTVKFHKLWLEKQKGILIPYITVLKDLHRLFPNKLQRPDIVFNDTNKESNENINKIAFNKVRKTLTPIYQVNEPIEKNKYTIKEEYEDLNQFFLNEFVANSKLAFRE